MKDFASEYSMYVSIFEIINTIFNKIELNGNPDDLLLVYTKLFENGIVKKLELELITKWLKIFLCCNHILVN